MNVMGTRTLMLSVLLVVACRTGRNYPGTEGPRYAGSPPAGVAARATTDTLRIVSFNVEFSRRVDSAIVVLTSDSALRGADVVLLQEMDSSAARRIAEGLGAWYVYYPAIFHLRADRQFGNAVVSRWPIVEDAKLILPHASRYAGTRRTATAATIRVGDMLVRLYSTHLGTPLDITSSARRNQLRAIVRDAERYERVVIGGDLNSESVGRVAREQGYTWPTEHGPKTTSLGRWDHIFLKGLRSPDSLGAGTVLNARGTGDHVPVWAIAILR
jgi:endonuclease/exonuclease/phosphatase family metal-dependent hydrolase